jgi:anti-sigma B factor antagonist
MEITRTLERTATGDVTVVRLDGRLDLLTAPRVRDHLSDALAGNQSRVIVDLADVSFIDSSGLGALIGALKAARQGGGDLRIARPSSQARLILELTSLDRVLRPYADVQDAIAGF